MGHLLKLGTLLLPPVDPVHQVLYVSKARVAPLLPLWAFQVPVVLVFWRRGEAGGTETGRGEKRLGRRVWGLALRHYTLQARGKRVMLMVVIVVTVVMVTAVMVRGGSTIHLKGRLGVRRSKGTSGRGGLEVRDI